MLVPGPGDGLLHSYVATKHDRSGQWAPFCNSAPRTKASVVRDFVDDEGELHRSLEFARWGLHPFQAKDSGEPCVSQPEDVDAVAWHPHLPPNTTDWAALGANLLH
ncbi:hypothetical protein [Brachybacterium sp. YJGR34]|uniref:hypothetical protein n=1 Tax=Brachybacterium sp. YJGR34 TaxID=2059911 RepID=UPI000E0AB19D|nr:hypothetical protein [Brachybacterium sp. YJGR34]